MNLGGTLAAQLRDLIGRGYGPVLDRRGEPNPAVEREAVIAMLERERRSLSASLIALALLCLAISFLQEPGFMFALLALRAASFLFTREAAAELERRIRHNLPVGHSRRVLTFGMAVTGITLALLLWPHPPGHGAVAVALIQATVIVTVTLIPVTLAALTGPRDAMLLAFFVTGSALVYFHPDVPPSLTLVFLALVIGVRIYSANTGDHIVSAAATTVENRQLSEELAEALAHAEFLGSRDPLTGLFNRRRLFEVAQTRPQSARRHLLTIDLDRFKSINDCFGHAVGDRILVAAAGTVNDWIAQLTLLEPPQAFRLGGEEFLVILEGMSDELILLAAEQLRMMIGSIEDNWAEEYPSLVVSASIGIADWHPGERLDDALVRADLACYRAKESGRNRVSRAA